VRHLAEMLNDVAFLPDASGARPILQIFQAFVRKPCQLVITHVLPVLTSPGLGEFIDVLLPWLQELSVDPRFHEVLLDRLIRQFPIANSEAAMIYLEVLEEVAFQVPPRLVRRLLGVLGECIAKPFADDLNQCALETFKSVRIAALLERVDLDDAEPMLDALVTGAGSGTREQGGFCRSALACVVSSRQSCGLVHEFAAGFRDREAEARKSWATVGNLAGVRHFAANLPSDPTVVRLAAKPKSLVHLITRA
jgi:hypothetical protein